MLELNKEMMYEYFVKIINAFLKYLEQLSKQTKCSVQLHVMSIT